jgi:CRP-like cAMP-binding protein
MTGSLQYNDFLWVPARNEAWKNVLHLGVRHAYGKNDIIIDSGHHVNNLYYIAKGQVRLSRVNTEGLEKILWFVSEGMIFGETPFFDGSPAFSMHCSVGESVIYSFSREVVYGEIASQYPEIWQDLLSSLASKVRTLSNQICNLSLADLKSQVCRFIFQVREKDFDSEGKYGRVVVRANTSQQELANVLGVHRVSISKVLGQLKREGVIEKYSKKEIIVAEWDLLMKCAARCKV